jgi:hypothetical protein
MPTDISANTRIHLAESLSRIDRAKQEIVSRISANLARDDGDETRRTAATSGLMDCLIDQARCAIDSGRFASSGACQAAARHFQEAGYKLPDFADVLVPVLSDVLGRATSPREASAWCETFWAVFGRHEGNLSLALPITVSHAGSAA